MLELAGALSSPAPKEYVKRHKLEGKTLVAVASGANVNFDRLRFVSERAEIGEQQRGHPRRDTAGAARRLQELLSR